MERIKFTERLISILKQLESENNYIAFELLYLIDPDSKYFNGLNITDVDVGEDYTFKVTVNKKQNYMKVGRFLRYYYKDCFEQIDISKFIYNYNKLKNEKPNNVKVNKIVVDNDKFRYNPKDPRYTFLSLVTKTYPYGHEGELLEFLPKLEMDANGNYYKIIGSKEPTTMFACHLDTVGVAKPQNIRLFSKDVDGDEIIFTDDTTILGADDKAGTAIMLYMMAHFVPGLYYFFIGEEVGTIGSSALSSEFQNVDYLQKVTKCISFDRRKVNSVITKQRGRTCCSDKFANALCAEYQNSGVFFKPDPTGVYTDSASFVDDIPECTNLSVGYNSEHSTKESQNMTFLINMCKASVKVNWEKLPIERKTGMNTELYNKHKELINAIKNSVFSVEVKVMGFEDTISIRIDLDFGDIKTIFNTLTRVKHLLNKYNVDDTATISGSYIKIRLK